MFDITFVHVGLPKTGSSAIQQACHQNRTKLANLGVFYPDGFNHPQFGSYFLKDPRQYSYNKAKGRSKKELAEIQLEDIEYMENLNKQIQQSKSNVMVLSYEGFPTLDVTELQEMRSYIDTVSNQAIVIMYCREPIAYAVSEISQRARTGNPMLWDKPPIKPYKNVCEKMISAFGSQNIIVRKFAREGFQGGDVRLDFFKQIGLSDADTKRLTLKADDSNTSLCAEAVLIAEQLRKVGDNQQLTVREFVHRYQNILPKIRGEKYHLTQHQYEEVVKKSKKHVDYLRGKFSIDFELDKNKESREVSAEFGSEFIKSIAEVIYFLSRKNS